MGKKISHKIINNRNYIAKEIGPYILNKNGKEYRFSPAKIGIELIIDKNKIITKNPTIINNYSHPMLMYENKPFQKISMPYNENEDITTKIIKLFNKTEKALKNYDEKKCIYCHLLSSPIFEKNRID